MASSSLFSMASQGSRKFEFGSGFIRSSIDTGNEIDRDLGGIGLDGWNADVRISVKRNSCTVRFNCGIFNAACNALSMSALPVVGGVIVGRESWLVNEIHSTTLSELMIVVVMLWMLWMARLRLKYCNVVLQCASCCPC